MNRNQDDCSAELYEISGALELLQREVEEDLQRVRRLPEAQIARLLRQRSDASRARADALLRRLVELREIAESRCRTLERLRARMCQIHGGIRPH